MRTKIQNMMMRKLAIVVAIGIVFMLSAGTASAQDWFKTGTGLGVTKARIAVPEFPVRGATPPALEKTFHDVLWADLDYCGILELVSPSFYPPQMPSQPSEVNFPEWAAAPANTYMLAYGNLFLDAAGAAEGVSRAGHRRWRAQTGAPICG